MGIAMDGEHYCLDHQGNGSHYASHNCALCKLQEAIKEKPERGAIITEYQKRHLELLEALKNKLTDK